jgi:hypothetical protein
MKINHPHLVGHHIEQFAVGLHQQQVDRVPAGDKLADESQSDTLGATAGHVGKNERKVSHMPCLDWIALRLQTASLARPDKCG